MTVVYETIPLTGCQSFGSKFNGMFHSAHPNIYQFIDINLLNMQIYIKIRRTHIDNKRNDTMFKETEVKGKMEVLRRKEKSKFEYYVQSSSLKFLPIQRYNNIELTCQVLTHKMFKFTSEFLKISTEKKNFFNRTCISHTDCPESLKTETNVFHCPKTAEYVKMDSTGSNLSGLG